MIFVIIIFFVSILTAFGILYYRKLELANGKGNIEQRTLKIIPDFSLRQLEKNFWILIKYGVQKLILFVVKYWIITNIRVKKWISEKWPLVLAIFKSKKTESETQKSPSFFTKALIESKYKIKRMKQKIKEEHNIEN